MRCVESADRCGALRYSTTMKACPSLCISCLLAGWLLYPVCRGTHKEYNMDTQRCCGATKVCLFVTPVCCSYIASSSSSSSHLHSLITNTLHIYIQIIITYSSFVTYACGRREREVVSNSWYNLPSPASIYLVSTL